MKMQKLEWLSIHPFLQDIEAPTSELERMMKLMHKWGQFAPVKVLKGTDGYVVDGLIRYESAKRLGWHELQAEIVDWEEDQILTNRSLSNMASRRSHLEIAKEALSFIERETAQGRKRSKDNIVSLCSQELSDKEIVKMSGDVYELACAVFDLTFGTGTLRKLIKLYLWHENATKELCDLKLFAKLDAREMSISKAYDLVVQFNKIAEERGKSPLADVKVFERKPKFKGADWELFYHSNQDLSILDDGQISTVVCSPPYFGVQANYKNAKKALGGKVQGEEKLMDEYIANQVLTYSGLKSKLKDDGSLFVVIGDAFQGRDLGVPEFLTVEMLKDGWKFQGKYIWCKNDQKPQQLKGRLLNTVEHVLHFTPSDDFKWNEFVNWTDEPIRLGRTSGKGYKDGVIRKGYYLERPIERFRNLIEEQNWVRVLKLNGFHKSEVSHVGRTNHPCPFPTNLAMFFIMLTTDIGDVVCDIYGGIGTVAYAAKVLHRRSISIDVDLEAIEFANKRLQLTEGDQISTEEELEELQLVFKGTAKKEWVKAA